MEFIAKQSYPAFVGEESDVKPFASGDFPHAKHEAALPLDVLPPSPLPRLLLGDLILPEGLSHDVYVRAFIEEFPGNDGITAHFLDHAGNLLRIDGGTFEDRDGNPKSGKEGHGTFARVVARTIMDPDEIWETSGMTPPDKNKKAAPRLKYIARWEISGRTEPVLAVFEKTQYGYSYGISGYGVSRLHYIEKQRAGVCVYRRP